MKNLFDRDVPLGWDEPISDLEKNDWLELLREAVSAGGLKFSRKTRPDDATSGPYVVGFGDGAFPAFCGVVYLVWRSSGKSEEEEPKFSSYLAIGKARITPLRGYTIPRSEICGAVLASRLILRVVQSLQTLDMPPVRACLILDSECTISCLESRTSLLKPFLHNRRAEILDNMEKIRKYCPMEDVQHVAGILNPADLPTRGVKLDEIGIGSLWQSGAEFLSLPRSQWPVSREFVRPDLPQDEVRSPRNLLRVTAVSLRSGKKQVNVTESNVVDTNLAKFPQIFSQIEEILCYNNNLSSRKRVIARLLRGYRVFKPDQVVTELEIKTVLTEVPNKEELKLASDLILVHGMIETNIALYEGTLDSLLPCRDGKMIVTRGRLGEKSIQSVLGVLSLPILMPSSRVAELFMWQAHNGYSGLFHRSVAETLAKSRSWVWIVRGKDLAKKVCKLCMICKKLRRNFEYQQMAELRHESSSICPPWTHVALDYAGPVVIRGEVNQRSRGKSWILVYICRSTKAVCLLATTSYDTSSFLMKHEEFTARKGIPSSIVSDRGTQLVKSGIVLATKETPATWKWDEVVRNNSASSWECVPIGSPHRNGLAESTVKLMKRSLMLALAPGTVLSYGELVTVLAKISSVINSRPLGLRSTSAGSQQEDFLMPITPNQLLLGRTEIDSPPIEYSENDGTFAARLAYVSEVYGTWWNNWIKQVLPTLMPIRRWKKESRNLQSGDVVMMGYIGNLKDDYRLAKVEEVYPDDKGLVRSVLVAFRKRDHREKPQSFWKKPLTREIVAIQRLHLLVPSEERKLTVNFAKLDLL